MEASIRVANFTLEIGGVVVSHVNTAGFFVPKRTARGGNNREHHHVRAERVLAERNAVKLRWPKGPPLTVPCTVSLTRSAPGRGLDGHDNLAGALKAVADEVARLLGVDDRDPRVTWAPPAQQRGEWGVWVHIVCAPGGAALPELPRPKPPPKRDPRAKAGAGGNPGWKPTPAVVRPKERP